MQDIIRLINSKVQDAIDGNISSLDLFLDIKQLSDVVEIAKKQLQEPAINEAEKYQSKTFEYKTVKITIMQKSTYDYKNIPAWVEQKGILQKIEERAKLALNANKLGQFIDEETGEVIQPPIQKISTFLQISPIK